MVNQQLEATAKVVAMTNAAEKSYYKDDDSISTLASMTDSLTTSPTSRGSTSFKTPTKDRAWTPISDTESPLVTSSITMESFLQDQRDVQGMQSRFNRMEVMLENVLNNQTRTETDESPSWRDKNGAGGLRNQSGKLS